MILHRVSAPGALDTPAAELERIAILPFENLGPSDEEYLAEGITDEIRSRLGGFSGLAVIGRQSSIRYRGTKKTAQEIGEELGADLILGGTISIRRSADDALRVRVRPQLTRASDDIQRWAEVYDEEITEPFQLETNIAVKVVAALDIALLETERRSIQRRPTDNLEAAVKSIHGSFAPPRILPLPASPEMVDSRLPDHPRLPQVPLHGLRERQKVFLRHDGR